MEEKRNWMTDVGAFGVVFVENWVILSKEICEKQRLKIFCSRIWNDFGFSYGSVGSFCCCGSEMQRVTAVRY